MSKRARVTPELICRVKEIKEERPAFSYKKIAELLWLSRKSFKISSETVGRILRGEYLIVDGKVVRVKPPSPGQIAMLKQFQKILYVTTNQMAEMSRENRKRKEI